MSSLSGISPIAQSLQIGVQQIGWYPSNLQARSTAVNAQVAYYGNQVVDQVFTQETIQPGWLFPPDLTAVTNLQGDDFSAAVTGHTSLSAALTKLQGQILSDLTGNGINAEGYARAGGGRRKVSRASASV